MGFDGYDAGAVPVILGWCQMVKGLVPESWKRFIPLFAVGAGVLYATAIKPGEGALGQRIALGFMLGMTAAGTWSSGKSLIQKKPAAATK